MLTLGIAFGLRNGLSDGFFVMVQLLAMFLGLLFWVGITTVAVGHVIKTGHRSMATRLAISGVIVFASLLVLFFTYTVLDFIISFRGIANI
jgi:hypothetical protein